MKLALLHHSTPTYIDSMYLCINDPRAGRTEEKLSVKPQIKVALESKHQLTVPSSPRSYDCRMVVVSFEDNEQLRNLQYTYV